MSLTPFGEQILKTEAERDQYKAERDTCLEDIEKLRERNYQLVKINDGLYLDNYKLEQDNNNLKQSVSEYKDYAESHVANYLELKSLEHENKALRLQSDTYFDEWQKHNSLLTEFSQHIGSNPSSSTYKQFRKQLDDIGIRERE